MNLIQYTKQATIHLKDWTEIEIPEEKINAVMNVWQNKWIINFWDQAIDSVMISRISEAFWRPDIKWLTWPQKQELKARIKLFKNNLNRDPSDEVLHWWVEKLKKWISI